MSLNNNALDEHDLDPDPIVQFKKWFRDALRAPIKNAEAMCLATVGKDGRPSARMVLLKQVDDRGFVFHTNYESRKGHDLSDNPVAALVFYWADLDRQVRIEGAIEKVTSKESDAYFATRPRESQLGALASHQSEAVESREQLDRQYEQLEKEFEGRDIPRPGHWGGYRLEPTRLELWQSRFARLNDRISYDRQSDSTWLMTRLAP